MREGPRICTFMWSCRACVEQGDPGTRVDAITWAHCDIDLTCRLLCEQKQALEHEGFLKSLCRRLGIGARMLVIKQFCSGMG